MMIENLNLQNYSKILKINSYYCHFININIHLKESQILNLQVQEVRLHPY
jgi:hypothetical protein